MVLIVAALLGFSVSQIVEIRRNQREITVQNDPLVSVTSDVNNEEEHKNGNKETETRSWRTLLLKYLI